MSAENTDTFYLATPQSIVWNYFEGLRRRVAAVLAAADDDTETKQDVVVCIMFAVLSVETFLNVYFRVVVTEEPFRQYEERFLKEISARKGLEYKLREWPKRILGKPLDLSAGIGAQFWQLKERRNALMHFTSSHETISFVEDGRNIVVRGLADMAAFAPLTRADAASALEVAENTVREIMRLRGVPEHVIPGDFHGWTGKVPLTEGQKAATIRLHTTIPPVTRVRR